MPHWTVDAPASLEFDEVTELSVTLIGGSVAVLAAGQAPCLTVSEITGSPLQVDYAAGALTVGYEKLKWEGLLGFLRQQHDAEATVTITVPADCPVRLGVVSASALVSGLTSGASVKGVSGDITLDGVCGDVTASTVSGEFLARDIDGAVRFNTVSGELALANGSVTELHADSVKGRVCADVALGSPGDVKVSTVSGTVALRLPGTTDAEVRLESVSGTIETEFDSLRATAGFGPRRVGGNVGAGTGHVRITTVSGPITLLRRPDRPSPRPEPPRAQAGMESETR
jgi:hypothetical protein